MVRWAAFRKKKERTTTSTTVNYLKMKILQVTKDRFVQLFQSLSINTYGYLIGSEDIIFNFARSSTALSSLLDTTNDDQYQLLKSVLPLGLNIIGVYMSNDYLMKQNDNHKNSNLDQRDQLLPSHMQWLSKYKHLLIGNENGDLLYFRGNERHTLESIPHVPIYYNNNNNNNNNNIDENKEHGESESSNSSFVLVNCSTLLITTETTLSNAKHCISESFIVPNFNQNKELLLHNNSNHDQITIGDLASSHIERKFSNDMDELSYTLTPPPPRETFLKYKLKKDTDYDAPGIHWNTGNPLMSNVLLFSMYTSSDNTNEYSDNNNNNNNNSSSSDHDNGTMILTRGINEEGNRSIIIQLNAFGYVSPHISLSQLYNQFREYFHSQLSTVAKQISGRNHCLSHHHHYYFTHHLPNENYPHVLTIVHSFGNNEEQDDNNDNGQYRAKCHELFYFSMNIPLLRMNQSVSIPFIKSQRLHMVHKGNNREDRNNHHPHGSPLSIKLNNIHRYVKQPPVLQQQSSSSSIIKCVTVKGTYTYYHYLQDKVQDEGWGCAYRSCQTLLSYLKHNHLSLVQFHVPTFAEMQEILVTIGDKPLNFLNSKQWIGALENSYIIDQLCQISCKILNVSNRRDLLDNHLRTLVRHFEEHGTPVMIGGGVLAYTLLGILYDEYHVDNVRFLILDPHYKGSDSFYYDYSSNEQRLTLPEWIMRDATIVHTNSNTPSGLEVMLKDGWCAWKRANDIFLEDTFYNFCMPQLPNCI